MLTNVNIINYRNLKEVNEVLDQKLNLIIAPNGTGKTNFIEAIYYTVFGESFRPVSTLSELIGSVEDMAKLSLNWFDEKLELVVTQNQRRFILNGKRTFQSRIPSRFPAILFAPQSVDLVAREPSVRRQDLDHYLSILNARYKEILNSYKTVLSNRNAMIKMIKDQKASKSDLEFWTDKLVENADEIYKIRVKFFDDIKEKIISTVESLNGQLKDDVFNTLDVSYTSHIEGISIDSFKEALRSKFMDNYEKEIVVGRTLYGVHRDDFQILLGDRNLRFFGSRGQQRIGVLLFKLSQAFLIEDRFGKQPILLLDDLMSELDNSNREKLAYILDSINFQVVLTTADGNEVPEKIKNQSKLISILQ